MLVPALLSFCLLLARLLQAQPALQDLPAELPCRYGVIGVQAETAGPDTLRIAWLVSRSPAARAGLQRGDLLLGALPYRLRTPAELSRYIQSLAPGDSAVLLIQRRGQLIEVPCPIADRRSLFFLMAEQGRLPPALDRPRHRQWEARQDSLEVAARALIQRQGAEAELAKLIAAFALEDSSYGSDCRLSDVRYALLHPLKGGQLAAALTAEFQGGMDLLLAAASHLDVEISPSSPLPVAALDDLMAGPHPSFSAHLLVPFFRAGLQARQAFVSLDSSAQRQLFSQIPFLLTRFSQTRYLDEGDSTESETHLNTLRLAKQVDLSALFSAAAELVPLTHPASLRETRRLAGGLRAVSPDLPPAFRGHFLYAQPTAWGWILVGDRGPNFYGEDAALIVDLGGDDTYLNNCGAPIFASSFSIYTSQGSSRRQLSPVGLIIDYGGDDRYLGNDWGSLGAAIGGVSLVLDLGGDDLYQSDNLGQGAAFCGIGILWDREGDDRYLAQEQSQGAAFFGAGLLLDEQGRDFYSAVQYSQGLGGARGLGLLGDQQGDDCYLADRKVPSSYGTEGNYNGWSQGVGCGFRGQAEGGLGLLLDQAGNDYYQAGNFSQGVGYFFSLGLLADSAGDDLYHGGRYAQGAAAHQAVGVLLDQAGDDHYLGRIAAAQGSGWDAALGLLEDLAGDDSYQAEDLAQGASAMNGLGLLFDWAGRDAYQAHSGQAEGGSTQYWGGRNALNLGLLLDGGGADTYNLSGRQDRAEFRGTGVGLFEDR